MKTILTGVRLKPSEHTEFKEIVKANKTSISKTLRMAVLLFVNDMEFQQRIMKEIERI
jgi:hypothetical protein